MPFGDFRALAESRFRVQAANAAARDILVIALDRESANLGRVLQGHPWRHVTFTGFFMPDGASAPQVSSWEASLEATAFDLVVMVGTVVGNPEIVRAVGGRCASRAVKVAAILIGATEADEESLFACLSGLRPWTHTLAVVEDSSDLPGLLHALGA